MAKKVGRPEIWNPKLADQVCEQIALGKSLRTLCKDPDMPGITTIFKWLRERAEFAEQYARATKERSEAFAEDILEDAENIQTVIVGGEDRSDNARVNAVKIKIDTKKWLMSKIQPKKYGDKLDLTSDGKVLPTPIYGGVSKKQNED